MEAIGWAWREWSREEPRPARDGRDPRSAPPSRLRSAVAVLLGLGGLCAVALAGGLLTFAACLTQLERVPAGRADGIVALTGGAQRIGDAIDLLAGGYGRRLLITGVNERTSRDEIARLNPSQRHWIDCCVDLDYRARNTIGNAIETRRWMRRNRFDTVAVVTSNYHMPRTLIELDHALMGSSRVVPHPVVTEEFDAARWWQHPASARLLAAEYLKFLAAWLRTRFEGDPEHSRAAILIGRGKPVRGTPVRVVAEPLVRDAD